jgi:hypothetical protein
MDNNILVHIFKVGKRFKKIKKYQNPRVSPSVFTHKFTEIVCFAYIYTK